MSIFPFSPFLIALAAMLWGGDLLLRPQALSAGWSPAWLVLGEHLILGVIFAPVLWRERRRMTALNGRQWGALLFIAWGGSALATWLYTTAFSLDYSRALTVILLQKTQPIFALLLAGLVLRERRVASFWGWCALALAGASLLAIPGQGFRWRLLAGIPRQQMLFALAASALWGAATVAGRSLTSFLPPSLLASARFALAVPALALLTLVPAEQAAAPAHTASYGLLFLMLIVLLPDLAGMGLYYSGLRGTPASVATLAELCYPLTSLLIGLFVQHVVLTGGQWLGLAFLLTGVIGLSLKPGVAVSKEISHELSPAVS